MDQSTLLYITVFISLASLGVSIFTLLRKGKVTEVVPPKPISRPAPKKKVAPPIVPVVPVIQPTPEPKEEPKEILNKWTLSISEANGKEFNIHIEWSDESSDIAAGTAPIEISFEHPRGIVPEKVVGMPPNGDEGLVYSWKLNDFHW